MDRYLFSYLWSGYTIYGPSEQGPIKSSPDYSGGLFIDVHVFILEFDDVALLGHIRGPQFK